MTIITNKDRQSAIGKILEDTFAPQLSDFKGKLRTHIITKNETDHPEFHKAAKDVEFRKYLKSYISVTPQYKYEYEYGGSSYSENAVMRWPAYSKDTYIGDNSGMLLSVNESTFHAPSIDIDDVFVFVAEKFTVSKEIAEEYLALARKRQAARDQLVTVFYSYQNREKFEIDFPELARFLPPRVIKSKATALAIPVADFKEKLGNLGIPPK